MKLNQAYIKHSLKKSRVVVRIPPILGSLLGTCREVSLYNVWLALGAGEPSSPPVFIVKLTSSSIFYRPAAALAKLDA